ncbi:MAG: hypothetical protein JW806_04225 [Sedimentisphaerales bacterium]|nr:hypothetical protein [Sedimentisphaerales bacterium]
MSNQKNDRFSRQLSIVVIVATVIIVSVFLFTEFRTVEVPVSSIARRISSRPQSAVADPVKRHYKVFHVMSYHSPWEWTDKQLEGFKAVLSKMDVEYDVMQMDTKRKSGEDWKREVSEEIQKAINTSNPDLIFANDDNAQQYVTKYYVNSRFPIVFSAVNEDPAKYGFTDAKNVTGVVEKLHYVPTLKLLQKLIPSARKIAMISDTGAMWTALIEEMKQQESQFSGIKVASYDVIPTFEEFKLKIADYQDKVDAIGFFGVFEFKDERGDNVPMEEVMKWLQANSKLPDFSFWEDRVFKGTLCSVSVSAYEQGYLAGVYARDILFGKSPADLPIIATERGSALINTATAKKLGIEPTEDTLRIAKTVKDILL